MLDVSGPRPSASSSAMFSRCRRHEQRLLVGQIVELRHAVVLEVVPDRQRLADLDSERRELVLGPDPRQHQQHRRLVGAGRQDHLALGAHRDHVPVSTTPRRRPRASPSNTIRSAIARGSTRQVGSLRAGRKKASAVLQRQPVALGQLEAPDALLARAVEVRVVLVPGRARGLEHRVDERVHRAAVGHRIGPPAPWNASSPRSLSSERLK